VDRRQKNPLQLLQKVFLTGFTAIFALYAGISVAKTLEHLLFPVVKDFEIKEVKAGEGKSKELAGVMNKVRDCKFIEVVAYDQHKRPVYLEFLDRVDGKTYSRAATEQLWGWWRVPGTASKITIYSRHSCHPLWETTTLLVGDAKI